MYLSTTQNPHYYREAAILCLVCACAGGAGDKGGKESFIEPISMNKSFTLGGFSLTTGYLDKPLPKNCAVNMEVFIDHEISTCRQKNRLKDTVSRKIKELFTLQLSVPYIFFAFIDISLVRSFEVPFFPQIFSQVIGAPQLHGTSSSHFGRLVLDIWPCTKSSTSFLLLSQWF